MHKAVPFLLAFSTTAHAELIFQYEQPPTPEQQRRIEACVKRAAAKYLRKQYVDRGAYDFIASKKEYLIHFGTDEQPGWFAEQGHWLPAVMHLDSSLVGKDTVLEFISFHEFSHGYDYAQRDKLRELEKRMPSRARLQQIAQLENHVTQQERAYTREKTYLEEMRSLPAKEYARLIGAYDVLESLRKRIEDATMPLDRGLEGEWRRRFEELYRP